MQALEHDVLRRLIAASLTDDDAFCVALAEVQGEFLVIHPFREGNARTIKLATDLVALRRDGRCSSMTRAWRDSRLTFWPLARRSGGITVRFKPCCRAHWLPLGGTSRQ